MLMSLPDAFSTQRMLNRLATHGNHLHVPDMDPVLPHSDCFPRPETKTPWIGGGRAGLVLNNR
jgi:hypothetical protein